VVRFEYHSIHAQSGLPLLDLRPSAAGVEQSVLQAKLAALRNDTRKSGWLDPLAGRSRAPMGGAERMQSIALREVERHLAMSDGWTGFTACRRNNSGKPLFSFY